MHIVVARAGDRATITELAEPLGTSRGAVTDGRRETAWTELADFVRGREEDDRAGDGALRWVWADTARVYPELLADQVRVRRCHDLRLGHVILRRSAFADLEPAGDSFWDSDPEPDGEPDLLDGAITGQPAPSEVLAEFERQWRAVESSARAGRLRLLLAAESVGALVAAEMRHDGLPYDVAVHDETLTRLLGPRPGFGVRPVRLQELADRLRKMLEAPGLNPDSPPELLQALHSAGLAASSTRRSDLQGLDHPVVGPLLEYKKLSRLLSANGWAWADAWVQAGRFRPEYLPGGVVTGRWATRGGGALQLPKQLRAAVRADPGRRLVVADAAQLEPRVLAAMAGDEAMADASRGADLYQALVDRGVVDTRAHAKVAMLGALYGATTGRSGQLLPRLGRAYPRAMGMVESAAAAGESYQQVSTWLGRSSPPAPEDWQRLRERLNSAEALPAEVQQARRQARDWGRFTRNFVVQGTAAEWALCWLGALRTRLQQLAPTRPADGPAPPPQLVYFLHDEVIVHTPADLADAVADAIRAAAVDAGRLLFGDSPVEFALDVAAVTSYDQA